MSNGELYRVREPFGVPEAGGYMRPYTTGQLVRGDDPILKSHGSLFEPADNAAVEAATAAPGERRVLGIRLPSGRPLSEVTAHRTGHAHKTTATDAGGGPTVAPFRDRSITPDDPRSPASSFAPAQPAAGVVAPDVPDEQNLAGAPKAGEENVDAQAFVNTASDPREGAGPVPTGKSDPVTGEVAGAPTEEESGDGELKGAALDSALKDAGLSTSGTAAEKRARLADHNSSQG